VLPAWIEFARRPRVRRLVILDDMLEAPSTRLSCFKWQCREFDDHTPGRWKKLEASIHRDMI
jgi:hypothetical protein